jgi:hypothetical protein
MFGTQLEIPFDFLNGIPKLGAPSRDIIIKEVPPPKVLSPNDVCPQTLGVLIQFPNPFEHQSDVHEFGVEDTQSSERFRLTHRSPIYHVILAFVAHSFPKEAAARFVHGLMSAIKK